MNELALKMPDTAPINWSDHCLKKGAVKMFKVVVPVPEKSMPKS